MGCRVDVSTSPLPVVFILQLITIKTKHWCESSRNCNALTARYQPWHCRAVVFVRHSVRVHA